jgi:hypothetical protein
MYAFVAVSVEEFSMGKGKFVNQKLGKNVSRKFNLLKSELTGRTHRISSSRPMNLSLPKKGTLPAKP